MVAGEEAGKYASGLASEGDGGCGRACEAWLSAEDLLRMAFGSGSAGDFQEGGHQGQVQLPQRPEERRNPQFLRGRRHRQPLWLDGTSRVLWFLESAR